MHKNTTRFSIVFGLKPLKRRIFGLLSVLWVLLLFFMLVEVLIGGSFSDGEKSMYTNQDVPGSYTAIFDNLNKTKTDRGNQKKEFDILINSYMRSGSSFTGQLLAFRPDTFYWYEPLLSYQGLYYFMGKYACIGNNTCGDFGIERINEVKKLLHNIYKCNLTSIATAVADNITSEYSGDKWKPFKECRGQTKPVTSCLAAMETICRRSKHRAIKSVRLTVDNLEYLLEKNENLKVIHLFRDPRAIINSELTTKWYNLNNSEKNDFSQINTNAYELCSRMKYDLLKGEKLKRKYPQRFAFVMFEDLQSDLNSKTEVLFSYFGIDQSNIESELKSLSGILQEDHVVKRKQGDYTDWWRFHLDFNAAKIIDDACADVLSFFGYKQFSDRSEYMNILHKGFNFRKEFLLRNWNKTRVYNFEALHNSKNPYVRSIDIINPKDETKIEKQWQLII